MAVTAADARTYALVKLRRVLRRANFSVMTGQSVQERPDLRTSIAPGQDLEALWFQLNTLLDPFVLDPNPPSEYVTIAEKLLRAGLLETVLLILTHSSALTYDCDPRDDTSQAVSTNANVREPQFWYLTHLTQIISTWYNALHVLYMLSGVLRQPYIFNRDVWAAAYNEWCKNGDNLIRLYSSNPYLVLLDRSEEHVLWTHRYRALKTLDPMLGYFSYPDSSPPT